MKTMSKTSLYIVACLCALSSLAAQRQGFTYDRLLERHDKDRDGIVTKEEFSGNQPLFAHMDHDKDGRINRDEFDNAMKVRNTRKQPENTTVQRDLEYAVEDGESLRLDLYLPENAKTAPALVVWIHGGGWKNGDKANVNPAILRLVGDGYSVASINYRLKDLSIHPKNIHDCKGAVRWLRSKAETYGYDPSRIAVGGGSAGGHLALLLGMSFGNTEMEGTVGGNTNQSTAVKAIIDLYGPSELTVMLEKNERLARSHGFIMEQLASASPLTYLSPNDPPVLILHGDSDKTVPVEQSQLLHERYQKAGLESELHIIEGAGHGGMVFSDEERYRLIKAFLDRHLAE